MGAKSWVTSKVHQRIDSLWRPWHTVRFMDRSLTGSETHRPALQNSPDKNNRLCFTFKKHYTPHHFETKDKIHAPAKKKKKKTAMGHLSDMMKLGFVISEPG